MAKKYKGKIIFTGRGKLVEENNKSKRTKSQDKYIVAQMIHFDDGMKRKTFIDSVYTGKSDTTSYDFVREKELHKAKQYSSKRYAEKKASQIGYDCEIETMRVIPVSKVKDYSFHNPLPRRPRW